MYKKLVKKIKLWFWLGVQSPCILKHARKNAAVYKSAKEVEMPIKYLNILLANYAFHASRILVFFTLETRKMIGNVKYCFGDGTFNCCQFPFVQLYITLGEVSSTNSTTGVAHFFMHYWPIKSGRCIPEKRSISLYLFLPMLPTNRILDGWNYIKLECEAQCLHCQN